MKTKTMLACAVLAGTITIGGVASAATIVTYDFNNYTGGSSQATQVGTGLQVFAYGNLPGFTKSGQNPVHAVQRSTGDYAVMLYNGDTPAQTNIITAITGVAANTLGQTYQVSFQSALAVYSYPSQVTQAGDGLLFRLLDSTNAAVASYTYSPTTTPFTSAGFSYTGTGTGAVRLSISGVGNSGQFGGAVDNVAIAAVPEPATWGMMIAGFGVIGGALRTRRRSPNVTFV